jgi:long-subunit fatty acid transport protein
MKKLTFLVAFTMLASIAFSSGLLTNTNQSAQFIRMMSRNASLDIDAVYFNPAGLIKLQNGWHFAISNQTVFQTKTVDCGFPLLNASPPSKYPNGSYYEGDVFAPVFPTAFAVYKKDKWAFSFGFGPNGGGGSAEFKRGLPSFEIPISKVVPGLAGLKQINENYNVTGYDADLYFQGSSIFWGLQLGATYKISDVFSVYGGVRYMPAMNSYKGTIKDIQLQVAGQMYPAGDWMTQTSGEIDGISKQAAGAADLYNGGAAAVQPLIDAGAGNYNLEQLEGAGHITASERAQIEGGLRMLGIPQDNINAMPVSTIQGTFSTAGATYGAASEQLAGVATTLNGTAAQMGDKEVDVEQKGAGITPIIGINISPNEDWNIGIKYEHKTYLTLKNKTKKDDLGLFPDGADVNSDVPGFLSVGVGFRGVDKLEMQFSFNTYFNKGVDWGYNIRDKSHREMDGTAFDVALGLQYNITDNFAFSVGGLYADMGVADSYQSDFSYSLPSFTPAAGIEWALGERVVLDAGVSNTFYFDGEVTFNDPDVGDYKETYGKSTFVVAVGLSYSIFK